MLEDQPLDLSVRVGDYAELTREEKDEDQRERKDLPVNDYGNEAAALRLRGCFATTSEYSQEREDRTCSEDSDDSCSDNNQQTKDGSGGVRSRSRPPGTKPYKKNLMRRYRESIATSKSMIDSADISRRPFASRYCHIYTVTKCGKLSTCVPIGGNLSGR